MRVLAGDVGGTKTAIAILRFGSRGATFERLERYPSAAYPDLEAIVEEFLRAERVRPDAAGFGVAGPVRSGVAKVTKLPWRIELSRLSRRIGIRRVWLLNDFVAAALGLPHLKPHQLCVLARGRAEPGGPMAILGAGTGLGVAGLADVGGRLEVFASEGGHVDFGPTNPLEDRLVLFLRARFGRASRDRILSGGGLALIYEFLLADGYARESAPVRATLQESDDRAADISRFGLLGRDRLSRKALELFVSIYGSEAGNAALQYRATGGVFIGGGIAPKILPALERPPFLRAFVAKPPMERLLARIPVRVVRDPRLGLIGAAAAAYLTTMERTRPFSRITSRRARS